MGNTDFTEIRNLMEKFEKTVKLWDFALNWKFKTYNWMNYPFNNLDDSSCLFLHNTPSIEKENDRSEKFRAV